MIGCALGGTQSENNSKALASSLQSSLQDCGSTREHEKLRDARLVFTGNEAMDALYAIM